MRQHLTLEIGLNAFFQRNAFSVTKISIGLGLAVAIAADFGGVVAFAEGGEHCLEFRGAQAHAALAIELAQFGKEFFAILEELLLGRLAEGAEQFADLLLPFLASF